MRYVVKATIDGLPVETEFREVREAHNRGCALLGSGAVGVCIYDGQGHHIEGDDLVRSCQTGIITYNLKCI
jgi:hypothetical protein